MSWYHQQVLYDAVKSCSFHLLIRLQITFSTTIEGKLSFILSNYSNLYLWRSRYMNIIYIILYQSITSATAHKFMTQNICYNFSCFTNNTEQLFKVKVNAKVDLK